MKRSQGLFLLFLVPLLNGCSALTENSIMGPMCQQMAVAALQITAIDAETGESVLDGATVTVRDGAFVESVEGNEVTTAGVGLAYERAGEYEIEIRQAGYQDWSLGGVRVERGECHVEPVKIEARLEKADD